MTTVIGVEIDETVEQTAQVALTSLCESRLADTAVMQSCSFRSVTKRILCGSSVLRLCPTSRALTSTLAWLRWSGTR
jgi:hypothetical protein